MKKDIISEIVETIEKETGTKLNEAEKQNITDTVDTNIDIHTGKKDGEIILDPNLKSDFMTRADYGDLGRSADFQKSFKESMNKFFELGIFGHEDDTDKERLEALGVDTTPSLTRGIMVNTKFHFDTDNVMEGKSTADVEISRNDVSILFTNACFDILRESSIGNVARAWSQLREALRQWFRTLIIWTGDNTFDPFYRIFVKDIEKGSNSVFKKAVNQALRDYKPKLDNFLKQRDEDAKRQSQPFTIKTNTAYTKDYDKYEPSEKSIRQPFMLRRNYHGRDNETRFIEFLENNSDVKSWFKNPDSGKESLSIRYYDTTAKKTRLFNPDWIVLYRNGDIGIFDTKGGITAKSQETKDKLKALNERIEFLNANSKIHYLGGMLELVAGEWKTIDC